MSKKFKNIIIVLLIPIFVYLIFFAIQPERFGTIQGIYIMFKQSFIPSILSWGLIYILTLGLYDFSIGSILVLASIIGADLGLKFGYFGLIFGCIVVAILLEGLNGIIFTTLKIPSLITTIGLLLIYETLGNLYKGGGGIVLSDKLHIFGRLPYNIILGIIAFIISFILFNNTRFGIYAKSVGSSEMISKSVGINVTKIKILGFLICGLFIGIASIITVSYGGIVMPQTGMNSLMRVFPPLMGCFFGIALKKQINIIIGIFIGEFTLTMISIGLITMGIDISFQQVVIGLFLIIIVSITAFNQRNIIIVK